MNGGWDEQFLAPLSLIPGIPRIPRIAGDEFQTARKACNLQYKTDFGDSRFQLNQTFSCACPKVVPEGPAVVKGGALGDFGVPLGTLVVPFASPRTPLGSLWLALGPFGVSRKPFGAPQGASRHPTI